MTGVVQKRFKPIILLNILFVLLVSFTSCKENKTIEKIDWQSQKTKAVELPKNIDSDFDSFIQYFNKDSIFQISRVAFPLKVKELDSDGNFELIERTISKADYNILNLSFSKENATKETDKYSQKIRFEKNKAIIEIRGIDNGIFTDIIFEKENGKWKLKTWIDSST